MNKDMISGAVAGVVVSVGLLAAHMAFSAITPCMMFSAYMPQNSAVCPQTYKYGMIKWTLLEIPSLKLLSPQERGLSLL